MRSIKIINPLSNSIENEFFLFTSYFFRFETGTCLRQIFYTFEDVNKAEFSLRKCSDFSSYVKIQISQRSLALEQFFLSLSIHLVAFKR